MNNLDHDTTLTANIAVLNEFGEFKSVYDGGIGRLWVYQASLGIVGIIRAGSWKDAYDIVQDEFMDEADETWNGIAKDCKCDDPDDDDLLDNAIFQENYGFRPNGPNVRDVQKHGIYQKDLNGDRLDLLTLDLMKRMRLTLVPAPSL